MNINDAIKAAKKSKPTVHDIYREAKAPREIKGINHITGNEIWGYVYSPELFVKSDATGRMCRYYIQVEDKIFHPDELASAKISKDGKVTLKQIESLQLIDPVETRKMHKRSFCDAIQDIYIYRHPTMSREETDAHQVTVLDKTTKKSITMSRKAWVTWMNQIKAKAFFNGWPTFSMFLEMVED